jgi:hypothetical protein
MFLGKQPDVGKAIVVPVAADDVVENAYSKNRSCLNESGSAIAVFP